MNARPGSLLWLLGHDARLAWRDVRATFGSLGNAALMALLVVVICVMHAAAWPIALDFAEIAAETGDPKAAYLWAAPGALFVMLLLLAQTLNGVTKLLYASGDLDLLLSAPVSPRRVLFVRTLGVAASALASASIFVVPLADCGLLTGHLWFAAIYPALLGAALIAAALGLVIGLGLFVMIGPRKTRLASQVLATFIGAGFIIGLQVHRLLPSFSIAALLNDPRPLPHAFSALALWPVRAMLGEPAWLGAWLALACSLFGLTSLLFGQRFMRSAILAANLASRPSRASLARSRAGQARSGLGLEPFRGGLMAQLRRKEWRLIARDPWVVSQILLQILYMMPMVALLWSGGSVALALGPMIVVVAFQLASSLTWLGLSGEDAPELLATAPVPLKMLRRGKFEAIGALALAVIVLPLGWLATVSLATAAATLGLAGMGVWSAMLLQLWTSKPAKRSAFAARHRESKLVALIEMVVSILWGVTTALVILGSLWAVVPLFGLFGALLCIRPRSHGRTA